MVTVKECTLTLPSYREPAAEPWPMFAENRVHQRSSGNPYPNRVVVAVDRQHREDKAWQCVRLENEYLCIELLPELGGRIYSALDKRTGYDFLYKQHVIKPALIGMLGSWISGGCEFNWPCHHRPSTFMPVDVHIERESDGAVTVWMSEHEPLDRMRGMVGVRLAPGEAIFDTRMRVYNRTDTRKSFLWWENAAVPVNEQYRLIFPPDVRYVQFHYRKNVTSYPVGTGTYNGIRMGEGVDLRYHRSTRQPTSYFSAVSRYTFFGGYDEEKRAGVIHVADPMTGVGKKMFTWAYNQLSQSWEKALTDTDGMYAELMASSYSLNQPDFTWLEAYEEKRFEQSWYPIGGFGVPLCADRTAAVSVCDGQLVVQVTRAITNARFVMDGQETIINATPDAPVCLPLSKSGETPESVRLFASDGEPLLRYVPAEDVPDPVPDTIPDNPTLDMLHTAESCYLTGVHVAQYRDPATLPEPYWLEALRYDENHAPSLLALARFYYERWWMNKALDFGLRAWKAFTVSNFHPESGECAYVLGLIYEARDDVRQARIFYEKATWAQDARERALTRIALLDGRDGDPWAMRRHAAAAGTHLAQVAEAVACLRLGDSARAAALLTDDPLDLLKRTLASSMKPKPSLGEVTIRTDTYQNALDIADDLRLLGEYQSADELLAATPKPDITAFPNRRSEHSNASDTEWACALYAKGHWAEAAALWENMPCDPFAMRNLAVAYYSHLGRRTDALSLLRNALDKCPDDAQLVWETVYVMGRLRVPASERVAFLALHCDAASREDIRVEWARALVEDARFEEALTLLASAPFTPCEGGEHAVAEQYMSAWHGIGRRALRAGDQCAAQKAFYNAQHLPDALGAGLWHEARLVPDRFFEALCLPTSEARPILEDICALTLDYFSNMQLAELPCYQAAAKRLLGDASGADALLQRYTATLETSRAHRNPGYFCTTPFFISYMDDAKTLQKASNAFQLAMVAWASGDAAKAATLAADALTGEPFRPYARDLVRDGGTEHMDDVGGCCPQDSCVHNDIHLGFLH